MLPRFFFLIANDVNRPVGGVMQIYRFANALANLGFSSTVVQASDDFFPDWFELEPSFNRISFKKFKKITFSRSSDYLIIPETFVPQYYSFPGIRKIIFNQNAGYTFGENLDINPIHVRSVYSDPLLSLVVCVSLSDYNFLHSCMGIPRERLIRLNNPIDDTLFKPEFPKEPVISFMSRKNRSHSRIILGLVESLDSYKFGGWHTITIENCTLDIVAKHMQRSFLFLSFGFPEGFGLPLAESLACGCRLVGYDGVGGKEIFSVASSLDCAKSVAVFDFSSYIHAVDHYIQHYNSSCSMPSFYENSHLISSIIRSSYSHASFERSCELFIKHLIS